MRAIVHTSGLIVAGLLLAAPAFAQKADIKAEVLKDWTDLKGTMVRISNEMPDDKFDFKATPAQRSYGEQILHVAGANANFLKSLGAKATAPNVNMKATSKAEIIKALEDSFDYGIAAINEQTSDSMLEQVKVPPFMGGMASRARVVSFLIGHTWDIYGQMAVYLRLNGKVPPASQRP
jgi:uncharacterized damage-inducible protein DinB